MTRTTFTKAYICLLFKTQFRQDQGEAYRDTKRGLFKGLSWDNWAAHWEQGELETELHRVQCSGSHLGLKITECYNCERLAKLEAEALCKAKKVANGHWPSKDNDVTSQVKWKCWSSSGREGFFTTFLTTHCMCGRVVMWSCECECGCECGRLASGHLTCFSPSPLLLLLHTDWVLLTSYLNLLLCVLGKYYSCKLSQYGSFILSQYSLFSQGLSCYKHLVSCVSHWFFWTNHSACNVRLFYSTN